jgi:hypothetical protein
MTHDPSTARPSPEELWAAYERQVQATATAWHDYEVLATKADAALETYQAHNRRRNELYDAYWATYRTAA